MSAFLELDGDVVELVACGEPASGALAEIKFRADAWLPDEIETLRTLFAADTPWEVIAAGLSRSVSAVKNRAFEIGLRRNSCRPWSELEDGEVTRRYGTVSAATLAQELGRGVASVYNRAQVLGVAGTNGVPYSAWEDAQIVAGYAAGVPVGQIATLIGRPLFSVASRAWRELGVAHAAARSDWSPEETLRALELAETGIKYLAIIEQLVAEGFPRRTKAGLTPVLHRLGYGRGWGRRWTEDEDELLRRAYATGESLVPLRRALGRTAGSLRYRAEELGLRGTHVNQNGWRGRDWTPEEEAILRAGYGKGTVKALAEQLNRGHLAVYQRAHALGLKTDWCRDWTPEEDRVIRAAWRHGVSIMDLARAIDRDPSVISRHCRKALGFTFNDRAIKAPRGRHALRPKLTAADILALEPNTRGPVGRDRSLPPVADGVRLPSPVPVLTEAQ